MTPALSQTSKKTTPVNWNNLALLSKTQGVNSEGIKIQFYKNQSRTKINDWIFPWILGFENYKIDSKLITKSEYLSYSSGFLGIGRTAIKHFKNNFFYNLSASFIIGNEKLTDYFFERYDRFFLGLTTSQGLLYIPKSKYGVVFGASLFEKAFTSKVYKFDLGIQLTVGVKF